MTQSKRYEGIHKERIASFEYVSISLETVDSSKEINTSKRISDFFFQINDGVFSYENNTLGRYCGQEIPIPVMSSTNVLRVQFKTDTLLALAGFNASYEHLKGIFMTVGQVKALTSARHRLF